MLAATPEDIFICFPQLKIDGFGLQQMTLSHDWNLKIIQQVVALTPHPYCRQLGNKH